MTQIEKAAYALLECDAAGPTSLTAAKVVVRTVLESLLEPSEAMIKAGGDMWYATLHNVKTKDENGVHILVAMLRAALEEQPEGNGRKDDPL